MKKFLIKILVFISLPIIYIGLNLILNTFFINQQKLVINKNDIFVFGDSHTDEAVNSKYLKNASNFSNGAEPYFFTYHKVKTYLEIYQPEIIILGFSIHNVTELSDHTFSNKLAPEWSYEMFKRSFGLVNLNQISKTYEIDLFSYYKALIMEKGIYPKKNKVDSVGFEFNTKTQSDVSDADKVIKGHFYDDKKEYGTSKISIKYIDSIAALCRSNKIDLILVNTPVHETYSNKIPHTIKQEYQKIKKKYIQNGINFFEDTINKYPDTLFRNSDHLNLYGSEKFTKELSKFLKDLD